MSDGKKILNRQQKEAVEFGSGPLLIIAGAGTGKTTVITERIKYLISAELAKPSEILALTFTQKAAREMEERVDVAMPYGYTQMWIMTFHSFGEKVLRDEAVHIGLDPRFILMTEAETQLFIRRHLFSFNLSYFRPLGNPNKFINGLIGHFSRLKDEDISPTEYIQWAQTPKSRQRRGEVKLKSETDEGEKWMELAGAYKKYEELKVKEGVMDFADLITHTLTLFRKRKNVLREYQKRFKYILVDEFQDTNISQNELMMMLAGKKSNLTVVADDDQSIYRFRGSSISNVMQFRENYPQAKLVSLTKNYRSTQAILDDAYKLIVNNNPDRLEVKERIDKKLKAVRGVKGQGAVLIYENRVENEAEGVVNEIKKLIKEGGCKYSDFAILVRANNHSEPFVRALTRAGLPYQFLGPGQLFRQSEVKDLVSYLKVLYNFEDNTSFYRVLSMEDFGINSRDIAAVLNFSRRRNLTLFEAVEEICEYSRLKQKNLVRIQPETIDKLAKIIKMIHRHLKMIAKETAGQILYYFLEDSGILAKLAAAKTAKEEERVQNIRRFFDKLKTYEVDHEEAGVEAVVDWINLKMELGESPLAGDTDWTENDAVNILTVHGAKGLEVRVGFIVNLVRERFPTRARREQIPIADELVKEILPEGDSHLQEERRLFYVGMTRAKDRLYFSTANYYGEGKRERKVSPYVIEVLGEKAIEKNKAGACGQLNFGWGKVEEVEIKRKKRSVNFLSYTQISTFTKCPLSYKYRYIVRIPVPQSAAASFGDTIHKTMRDWYKSAIGGRELSWDEIYDIYKKNWVKDGYASKKHEEMMFKRGKKFLEDYQKNEFDRNIKVFYIEELFRIPVGDNLKIGGRVDRVDDLGGGKVEIIDYKTGSLPTQKKVDKDLQMTIYALAVAEKGFLGKDPKDVLLSFYFFGENKKLSTKRTKKDLKLAKEEIIKKADEIEKSDFKPKPSKLCDFCEFRMICEAW